MPLKLTDVSQPASTQILNKWALRQETTTNTHASQIARLNNLLLELFKQNPTLTKPNGL